MFTSNSATLPTLLSDRIERQRALGFAQSGAVILAASVFVALCAHIAVPLPLTPVPFTLQPFAVLLVGMLLGPFVASSSMVLYLLEGAASLPVFTPGGLPGISRLIGPTGGYLLAYPLAALLAGALPRLLSRWKPFLSYATAGIVAMFVIYGCGAFWFSHVLHLPFGIALSASVMPFAATDVIKVLSAAAMASTIRLNRASVQNR